MEERFPFFLVRVKTLGVCHSVLVYLFVCHSVLVYLFVCHSGLVYLCLLLITAGSLRSTFPASTVKEYLSAEDVSVRDRGQPNHPSDTQTHTHTHTHIDFHLRKYIHTKPHRDLHTQIQTHTHTRLPRPSHRHMHWHILT